VVASCKLQNFRRLCGLAWRQQLLTLHPAGLSGKGAKGTMAKGDKKKPVSKSIKARPLASPAPPALTGSAPPSQAGLQFPVGRIHRFLKARLGKHSHLFELPFGRR